jgi:hypothetical protein
LSKSDLIKTKVEKYPLPDTMDGVVDLFKEIMSAGLVQRIEFDIHKPVRVIRAVEGEDLEEPNIDLEGALRHVDELVEYTNTEANPFETLIDMMMLIQAEDLSCSCWAVGTGGAELLLEWLQLEERGMPAFRKLPGLLGLPLHILGSLSKETLILCGSKYLSPDPDEISFAVKTAIEMRKADGVPKSESVEGSQAGHPRGTGPQGSAPTAYPVGAVTRKLKRVEWEPAD